MALPLVLFAVLASTIQARTSDAQDERTNLKARFVHDLARNGRFQWKSVTFLFNRDTIDDWIIDVSIPKTMFELPSAAADDSLNLSTTTTLTQKSTSSTNAYVILSNQQSNAMMKRSIVNMLSSKRLDATKTFILFSERTEEFLVDSDIDLIAVEERRTWNPRTEAVNKPVLKFRRRRTLSTLKPSEMTGVYDGTTALTEAQKRILFDTSFSYGGRKVRVTTFPVPPTTVKCADNASKFCGRDPNLIRHIGELLHFDPVFVLPEPLATKWGDKLDNGSWTGLIGSVSSGKTTLGVANVFTSLHYLEQVEMSYPYDSSCSTFLTPAPEVWPQFYTLVKPFDISLWLATIFSLFFGGLLIQMMARVYYRLFGSRDPLRFFGEAMIYNAQSITGVRSGSEERSPWPVRAYNSFWWLFCFVIGTIYRTGLTSWLASSPILTQPIDTIEQLVHSGLTPYGFNTFVRDLAQYSIDPYTIELGRRLQVISSNFTEISIRHHPTGLDGKYVHQEHRSAATVTRHARMSSKFPRCHPNDNRNATKAGHDADHPSSERGWIARPLAGYVFALLSRRSLLLVVAMLFHRHCCVSRRDCLLSAPVASQTQTNCVAKRIKCRWADTSCDL